MKQNHYILFPSLPYFAFKSLAHMNEGKASSKGITSILYVLIYGLNTAIISGKLQSTKKFQNVRYTNNGVSFASFSSAVIRSFSSSINTYRANTLIIVSVFFLLAFIASFILYAFQLFWLVSALGVTVFLIPGTLYLLKSNFTEAKF